ncbi:MAG: hypothetical protein ACOC46_01340 [Pirellulales bacterium]
MPPTLDRRTFLREIVAGAGSVSLVGDSALAGSGTPRDAWPGSSGTLDARTADGPAGTAAGAPAQRRPYRGPNVVLVRFGGGVRRRETIEPQHCYSPLLYHELIPRGTFFPRMEIASLPGLQTGHGQGTLNILTGKYDRYEDVHGAFLGERFEAKVPTIFEYLRSGFDIAEHEALIVNGEDRINEEFYTFSNHHLFGVRYRSDVLSLFRFKTHLLRRQVAQAEPGAPNLQHMRRELAKMEALDHRVGQRGGQSPQIESFWDRWAEYYGTSGLVNPRGDRVLTELAVRAIRELRPKFLMINYNDCDYVHWGNMTHYTRGITIMDRGLRRLMETVEADENYRGNTVFVVVPDCGRDTNRFIAVPCQHHFGSRSAHEIFALFFGAGVRRGVAVDRRVDQISVAATLGALMGYRPQFAEGPVLAEAIA